MVVLSILGGRGRLETPVEEVAGVESDAKQIGWDASELRGADADDANDGAVYSSNYPSLPEPPVPRTRLHVPKYLGGPGATGR